MGREPPGQFFERPEIAVHLQGLWTAFFELSTERQIGMGLGPIPRSKVRAYLVEELDLCGDALERAYTILRMTDDAYLGIINTTDSKTQSGRKGGDEDVVETVKATDLVGVKQLMRRLGKKPKGKDGKRH